LNQLLPSLPHVALPRICRPPFSKLEIDPVSCRTPLVQIGLWLACLTVPLVGHSVSVFAADAPFELRKNDRVAFLGDTLVERAGRYGYVEAALTLAFPDHQLTFRNLGWSGDNVFARSRDYFDKQGDGYARLRSHVDRLKPTVMFLAYGGNEAWDGEAGLAGFVHGYERLLGELEKTGARFVLMSPLQLENLGPPLPNPAQINRSRAQYAKAIAELAARRGHRFVDLFHQFRSNEGPLTYNGIHLDARGYRALAETICAELGLPRPAFDGKDPLLAAIVAKNRLYFYRWRPQNETYLFGHRKHEQGNNAVEVPQFDPLVAAKEREIAALLKSARQ
jgi:lysophospholipase L1-like esterase